MKRQFLFLIMGLGLLCTIYIFCYLGSRGKEVEHVLDREAKLELPPVAKDVSEVRKVMMIGERSLEGFHDPLLNPIEDLKKVKVLFSNYRALVKSHENVPVGGNGDLMDVLLGKNPYKQKFLPNDYQHLSAKGELLDRWGNAIWVHPISGKELELRSAGPDGVLFNEDDVVLE